MTDQELQILWDECEDASQHFGNYELFAHWNYILASEDSSLMPIR